MLFLQVRRCFKGAIVFKDVIVFKGAIVLWGDISFIAVDLEGKVL